MKIQPKHIRGVVNCMLALGMLAVCGMPSVVRAETKEVRIAQQFGLQFLAVNVMVGEKLIEKHARALGLGVFRTLLLTCFQNRAQGQGRDVR